MNRHERAKFLASAETKEPSPESVLRRLDELEMAADAERILNKRSEKSASRLLAILDSLDREGASD